MHEARLFFFFIISLFIPDLGIHFLLNSQFGLGGSFAKRNFVFAIDFIVLMYVYIHTHPTQSHVRLPAVHHCYLLFRTMLIHLLIFATVCMFQRKICWKKKWRLRISNPQNTKCRIDTAVSALWIRFNRSIPLPRIRCINFTILAFFSYFPISYAVHGIFLLVVGHTCIIIWWTVLVTKLKFSMLTYQVHIMYHRFRWY